MLHKITLLFLMLFVYANTDSIDQHPNWKLIPTDKCGTTLHSNIASRIFGGKMANLGQFPWIVRIGYRSHRHSRPSFNCAGSLIAEKFVLTAGHCDRKNNVIRVGEYDTRTIWDCDEQRVHCSSFRDIAIAEHVFNLYGNNKPYNDIALIRLNKSAEFNEYVRPICLPRGKVTKENLIGKTVNIAGWGNTENIFNIMPDVLMYVTMPIINEKYCNAVYATQIKNTQLCIGYAKGRDSCSGDSGGGATKLMRTKRTTKHFLIGVVSYGKEDCGTGPAVYTKVQSYLKEILDHIKD